MVHQWKKASLEGAAGVLSVGARRQVPHDGAYILCQVGLGEAHLGRGRVTHAAQVGRDHREPGRGQARQRRSPRGPCVGEAVQRHDGRPLAANDVVDGRGSRSGRSDEPWRVDRCPRCSLDRSGPTGCPTRARHAPKRRGRVPPTSLPSGEAAPRFIKRPVGSPVEDHEQAQGGSVPTPGSGPPTRAACRRHDRQDDPGHDHHRWDGAGEERAQPLVQVAATSCLAP